MYLDFVDYIEGIRIARIREDDLHQGVCDAISAIGRTFKGILEISRRVLHRSMATKNDKACDTDALSRLEDPFSWNQVMTYNTRVKTLTMPMPLDSQKPARVLKVRTG